MILTSLNLFRDQRTGLGVGERVMSARIREAIDQMLYPDGLPEAVRNARLAEAAGGTASNPEAEAQAMQLREKGHTLDYIARVLGTSRRQVQRYLLAGVLRKKGVLK